MRRALQMRQYSRLSAETVNGNVLRAQYAVRGHIAKRAEEVINHLLQGCSCNARQVHPCSLFCAVGIDAPKFQTLREHYPMQHRKPPVVEAETTLLHERCAKYHDQSFSGEVAYIIYPFPCSQSSHLLTHSREHCSFFILICLVLLVLSCV